ncbi:hypothetical protein K438DRAFT_1960139 [Mycena galopus ATCC 62051]|nr:hypothetical protein K438DRAFT_1960139 [Mycena galopus ATCC 62051]
MAYRSSTNSRTARDLPFLQQLGVNAIHRRLDAQHTTTTLALPHSAARAYKSFWISLCPTWSTNLQDEYIKTFDAFSKYNNVLAYNVGNEVFISSATNAVPSSKPPPATSWPICAPFSFFSLHSTITSFPSLSTARSPLTILVLSRCSPSPPLPIFSLPLLICILMLRPPSTSISSSALVEYAYIDGQLSPYSGGQPRL